MPPKRKPNSRSGKKPGQGPPPGRSASLVQVRKRDQDWELVHPRCAQDRADDLDEVRKMIEHDELDIAQDELRWLLGGCTDCLLAHKMLGEVALADQDLPLARGHFGYAFQIGSKALERAGVRGPLPYRLPPNQAFFEAGKGLAFCLRELDKRELAAEVVELLLTCDPSDPLGVRGLLA